MKHDLSRWTADPCVRLVKLFDTVRVDSSLRLNILEGSKELQLCVPFAGVDTRGAWLEWRSLRVARLVS